MAHDASTHASGQCPGGPVSDQTGHQSLGDLTIPIPISRGLIYTPAIRERSSDKLLISPNRTLTRLYFQVVVSAVAITAFLVLKSRVQEAGD